MKLLKRKNFQSLIYAIFISLPILSILPSTIYFAFNHEASNYTHEEVITTYEYETNEVNSASDLVEGNIYKAVLDMTSYNMGYTILETNYFRIYTNYDFYVNLFTETKYLAMSTYGTNGVRFTLNKNDETIYMPVSDENEYTFYFLYYDIPAWSSTYLTISASDYLGEKNVQVIESEMNPLSAFDTAISKFVSENDFGNIDFFTFFSSLFLTSTSMNNLYIHFINWYLNYILYISLAYLLFSVLLWFVNFARRLLEDSQNINIGGF